MVTGGVLSGLGKGVVSASIGKLLYDKKIIPIKCDGYLNVDPGTMNPFEHGEVFVLEDGGEVDMDFGHYERFMNISAKGDWNLTSGKVFGKVISEERQGKFLGKTVQIIPHVTDEIKKQWREIYDKEKAEIGLIEIGGTVGDIENTIYFEAVRQLRLECDEIVIIHLTYVPLLSCVGEQKTKPTQQAVSLMLQKGLQPDIIICRSKTGLEEKSREKIALFCNVKKTEVISNPDISTVYELPLIFKAQQLDLLLKEKLKIKTNTDLTDWSNLVDNIKHPKKTVKIAMCGKYTALRDAYISITEALIHAGAHLSIKPELEYIETSDKDVDLSKYDGIIVPGGFGKRGSEGKIYAIKYARENNVPFLGLCLGMQLAVVEYARNVLGLKGANSSEMDPNTKYPVVCLLPDQLNVKDKGATMRLGAQKIKLKKNTKAMEFFNTEKITKRFRHRLEINPKYVEDLTNAGLIFSGTTVDEKIMQLLELPNHKFFMASQFHPELTSKLEEPEILFLEFLRATLK